MLARKLVMAVGVCDGVGAIAREGIAFVIRIVDSKRAAVPFSLEVE